MRYTLEREVDGEWWPYGTYDVANENELQAMITAAQGLIERLRVVRCEVGKNVSK